MSHSRAWQVFLPEDYAMQQKPSPGAREIFDRAIDIESPAERQTFIAQACLDSPDLLSRVEALLRAHLNAGSFLESPAVDLAATIDQPIPEAAGNVIGRYKLLQQIGEGG